MFSILRSIFDDDALEARAETPNDGVFDRTAYRHPFSDMHKVVHWSFGSPVICLLQCFHFQTFPTLTSVAFSGLGEPQRGLAQFLLPETAP